MRLLLLPVSILSLIPCILASQSPLTSNANVNAHSQSTTLVDALSADPDYTSLIKLLQRARLIPTLNRLNGSTLFAPTNDAIARHIAATSNSIWQAALSQEHEHEHEDELDSQMKPDDHDKDNVNEALRQELFYHLLNYTLRPPDASDSSKSSDVEVQTEKTLHYPRAPTEGPSDEPPPGPPWMPIPGGTLGGEPQRIRVTSNQKFVGVNCNGKDGVEVVKGRLETANGVIYGIGDVLPVPPNLAQVVAKHSSLSYIRSLLPTRLISKLSSNTELTLFLPTNDAWKELPDIERTYLESSYAEDDLESLLEMHTVETKKVQWSSRLSDGTTLTTLYGSSLEFTSSSSEINVSLNTSYPSDKSTLIEPDIFASNGVLHLISSLLIPPGSIQPTPEKYLLTLNCTTFVSLIHSVNLTSLINSTESNAKGAGITILAPRDDVLELYGRDDGEFPKEGSPALKRLLQYHFLPGIWGPEKLKDGALIETMLEEDGLEGGKQVLRVDVSPENGLDVQVVRKSDKPGKKIRFAGAGILDEPIPIDGGLIYLMSRPIEPPTDALKTILPSLEYSTFLASLYSTSLADVVKRIPRTTFLVPTNEAWKNLGLVTRYLLEPSKKADLKKVILHHILGSVEYGDSLVGGSGRTFQSLEGSDIYLERHIASASSLEASTKAKGNTTLLVRPSGGWPSLVSRLTTRDILTSTGVIHELSDVLIPRTVGITRGGLVRAAKAEIMMGLVERAGLGWVLDGKTKNDSSALPGGLAGPNGDNEDGDGEDEKGLGWAILCPTDDAFENVNLPKLWEDEDRLKSLVRQHIIPVPASWDEQYRPKGNIRSDDPMLDWEELDHSRPLDFDAKAAYTTLQSKTSLYGDLVIEWKDDVNKKGTGSYFVRVASLPSSKSPSRPSAPSTARIITWGRTSPMQSLTPGGINGETSDSRGGVILIDNFLMPYIPPWQSRYGPPIATGIVGVVLIGLFFAGVRRIWKREREATYEPAGGFNHTETAAEEG
ncbi:FAS1 domain-containing protein [Sistotremastrum niveocremeum HHB9708]|uniref:FAS1 domain-containing protein n=1 Tax=Sistotremastrum niveocremeum HHB9708 TaxID=1314777 RepID=A0A164X8G0_9AGAM|nr:FAS1 domain-containing protein [Sistotremastrum niveocremeum HHB9708]